MEEAAATSPRVLIVDNDEALLSTIEEDLKLRHYQVTSAYSGLDALVLLRSQHYHVLVTDIVMPDISGLGLIEITRKEFPELPVIAMTGYGQQVKDLVAERSPNQYLEKPFDLSDLSKAIETNFAKE